MYLVPFHRLVCFEKVALMDTGLCASHGGTASDRHLCQLAKTPLSGRFLYLAERVGLLGLSLPSPFGFATLIRNTLIVQRRTGAVKHTDVRERPRRICDSGLPWPSPCGRLLRRRLTGLSSATAPASPKAPTFGALPPASLQSCPVIEPWCFARGLCI